MSRFCFTLVCDLREDTPSQVIETLKYMTRTQDYEFNDAPDGVFFEDDYWRTCLSCSNEGFYFPGEAESTFRLAYRYNRSFNDGGAEVYLYTLSIRCESNDDGISTYVDLAGWLAPYSKTQGFVGYWIYEYSGEPTLVFFSNGQLFISDAPAKRVAAT